MIDGIGEQHSDAKAFGTAYFDHGCLVNASGLSGTVGPISAINQHALYDAARRWSKYVRMIPRQQLIGYAVENGKSILWFKRYSLAAGGRSSRILVANGSVEYTRRYEVDGANPAVDFINYNGVDYFPGDQFIGVSGEAYWNEFGSPTVYLLNPGRMDTPDGNDAWDGIADAVAHQAPECGWTNEWLLGLEFRPYHTSESSLWKPDAYSDYFIFGNRCHFYSPELANDAALLWHTSYGQRIPGVSSGGVLSPEIPSGWNYVRLPSGTWGGGEYANHITVGGTEFPTETEEAYFYKSCRVVRARP